MNFAQFAAEEGWSRTVRSDDALEEDALAHELERHIAYAKAHPVSTEWKQNANDLQAGAIDPRLNARTVLQTAMNQRAIKAAYAAVNLTREQQERQAKNRLMEAYKVDFTALRRETLGR